MESFSRFINEAKSDSELKKLYDQFNKKYFNNDLPDDIEIKYKKMKGAGGRAKGTRYKKERKTVPESIEISSFYVMDDKDLHGILLHEMIHIWEMINGYRSGRDSHSLQFRKKREEILKKVNLEIPLKYETDPSKLNVEGKNVDVLVGYYKDKKDKSFISVFKDGLLEDNKGLLKNVLETSAERRKKTGNFEYIVVKSDIKDLQYYPIRNKIAAKSGFKIYKADQTLIDKILQERVLYKF